MITAFTPVRIIAQTEFKDRYVSIAKENQLKPAIARPTKLDVTVVVFEDERHASDRGSDIYIQCINNTTGLNLWIAWDNPSDLVTERFDGIAVCTAERDQRNPQAAYDGMDGVIVTWEDYRDELNGSMADIYAQRFELSTGKRDPNWPLDGIPICQLDAHAERPRIVGTNDGAYITWIDHRNNLIGQPTNRDVFVQYVKSATASYPPPPTAWVQNGLSVATNLDPDQINPELDVDNIWSLDLLGDVTQGVIVTYQDNRLFGATFGTPVWTVYANRIDADGTQLYNAGPPPWTADVAVSPSYEHQEYPRIVTTSKKYLIPDPSAIIVWQDMIDDPTLSHTDVYAQKLDALGNPQFPGPNGLGVCVAPDAQHYPQMTLWESGNPQYNTYVPIVTLGWEDRRNYAPNGIDIYAGLLDANGPGMLINPSAQNGDPVCVMQADQYQLSMDNLGEPIPNIEYTVFCWTHTKGGETDIWYQRIELATWIETRPPNGWPVTEAKAYQIIPQVNREVFVWQDGRRDPIPYDNQDDENIYCQTPGECTGPTEMQWRDVFAKWTFGRDAANFRFVADPDDGSTFIVWDEIRQTEPTGGIEYRIAFIQKLDKDGVPRWSNNGVALSNYNNPQDATTWSNAAKIPDVCIDAQGGARSVWQQTHSSGVLEDCWASHIPADGVPIFWPQTWGANRGTAFLYTEPRIVAVNNAVDHAMMGVLLENPVVGTRIKKLNTWNTAGGGSVGFVANLVPGITYHDGLQIAWDGADGVYSLTHNAGSGLINIAHTVPATSVTRRQEPIAFSSFGGYDLTATSLGAAPRPAYFAWSTEAVPGAPYEVELGYFYPTPPNGVFARRQITANAAPTPPQQSDSKYPTLTGDNRSPGGVHEGVLLAWDTQVYPLGGNSYHKVESNRANVAFIFLGSILATPEFPAHLVLDNFLTSPSYPDIARVTDAVAGVGPFGVVVWEGGGEGSPCTPPRPTDIMGQHVLYDAAAMNPGAQWNGPQMIAPGGGNYHQTRPQVQPSLLNAVSVFWYDGQSGNTGVMGTRLPDLTGVIMWAKESVKPEERNTIKSSLRITSVWPQPASEGGGEVFVSISAGNEADCRLVLYDLLGRERAVLHSGAIDASGRIVSFSPSVLGMQPGAYILRLYGIESQVTRKFTIIR
jgi:hypothetical protein